MEALKTNLFKQYGHPEFLLRYEPNRVIISDLEWLINFFKLQVESGRKFQADQIIQVGWSILKISGSTGNTLLLTEPDFLTMPINFVDSVTETLWQMRSQKDVNESVNLYQKILFPTIRQSAIKCSRYDDCSDFSLNRFTPLGNDSGWFIGCVDPNHDHNNPTNLIRTSLYELACSNKELIPFLALPPDCSVIKQNRRISLSLGGKPLLINSESLLAQWFPFKPPTV